MCRPWSQLGPVYPGRQSHSPVTWWQRYDCPQDGQDMLHCSPNIPALHSGRWRYKEWASTLGVWFWLLSGCNDTHCSDRWLPSSLDDTHMLQFPLNTSRCWGNAWSRSGYSDAPTGLLSTAHCSGSLQITTVTIYQLTANTLSLCIHYKPLFKDGQWSAKFRSASSNKGCLQP